MMRERTPRPPWEAITVITGESLVVSASVIAAEARSGPVLAVFGRRDIRISQCLGYGLSLSTFFFFFKDLFILRARERAQEGEWREGQGERIFQADSPLSAAQSRDP